MALLAAPALQAAPVKEGPLKTSPAVAPSRTESIAQYRQRLQNSIAATRTRAQTAKTALPALRIRRDDGATQQTRAASAASTAAAEAPSFPAFPVPTAAARPKSKVEKNANIKERWRQSLEIRVHALDEWQALPGGTVYQPIDSQRLVAQLVNTGQIRTGPTWMQQRWANFKQWLSDLLDAIANWLSGTSGKITPHKMKSWDPRLVAVLYYSCICSLLAILAYLLYKNLGGSWGRAGAHRKVRYLDSEDAELLRLPADELRRRAAEFVESGNYREALRHLYLSALVGLDSRGMGRYDTHRTNWEHIQALAVHPLAGPLVEPMSSLTRRFDRVRYGNAAASQLDWLHFERDVNQLDEMLASLPTAGGAGTANQRTAAAAPSKMSKAAKKAGRS